MHLRVVFDLGGQGRRDGDDHPLGPDGQPVRVDPDSVVEPSDPTHRRLEHHPRAQPLREPQRDQLGAAHETGLLGAAGGRDQSQQAARVALVAGGRDVEEDEQE